MRREIEIYSLPGRVHFQGTAHELYLLETEQHLAAIPFLLAEWGEQELRHAAPSHSPSWKLDIIGTFLGDRDFVLRNRETGRIYVYANWCFPANADFLANDIPDLLRRLESWDPDADVWAML